MTNARPVSKGQVFLHQVQYGSRCQIEQTQESNRDNKQPSYPIASEKERLGILKPIVHLSFSYDVLSGLMHNYLTFITSLFIYCEILFFSFYNR